MLHISFSKKVKDREHLFFVNLLRVMPNIMYIETAKRSLISKLLYVRARAGRTSPL